jgi:RHS repeat-associated protein
MGNYFQRADAAQYGVSGEAYAVIDTAQYDAYGNMIADIDANDGDPATSREESIGFGGQWGYFTDYDTWTGRFINRDPIGYGGGTNLYAFCEWNPVNEMDPEGTQDATETDPVETPGSVSTPANSGFPVEQTPEGLVRDPVRNNAKTCDCIGRRLTPSQRLTKMTCLMRMSRTRGSGSSPSAKTVGGTFSEDS